ncbi:MAG: universal stress protein [Deltaproteobacteria bacterium]|nr:universal stress protein [Deltaproteobacteria bacterium]
MVQRILVGLDGSPLAETILPYVGILAKGVGADVTLLHVVHIPEEVQEGDRYQSVQPLIQQANLQAQDYLSRVTQQLTDAGLKVESQVTTGDTAAEIVRYAQEKGMELIALATHGRSGLQRWFHGSVTEKVLHTTQTPLLLIRPIEEQAAPALQLTQIVVPLDGSPAAEAALPLAEALAASCKVPLVLVQVVETLSLSFADPGGMGLSSYPQILEGLQEAADIYMQRLAATVSSQGFSVQTETPLGTPADRIVEYVHDHPGSLVVMTTHGRTGLAGLVLGSVARRVVQHGNTPTLVVRPPVTS